MGLFSRSAKTTTHRVLIHFAQPMSPPTRHRQEDGILGELMPRIAESATLIGGGTALSDGEPVSADIEMEVVSRDMGRTVGDLMGTVEGNGVGRGSYVKIDDVTVPFGDMDFVLLRTGVGDDDTFDVNGVAKALQAALGDGKIGWQDDTYGAADGPVFVFSGSSAAEVLASLRGEIARQPSLANASLVSVTPGAAEGPAA